MRDIYLMNRETGEIVPSVEVFHEFYKTHGIFDSVFDYWAETDLEVEDSFLPFPDFSATVKL